MGHVANFEITDASAFCPGIGRGGGDGEPLTASITQSTTFRRDGVGSNPTHQYSRVSNPTVAVLEDALGQLENALPAACFGSGLAAETALFLAVLRAGDHVVCGRSVYGGTVRLLREVLPGLGIEATFVDTTDVADVRRAVRENTKLVFVETPSNPVLEVSDIRAIAVVARQAGALLAVDNTFQTAVLQRPLDLGADISVYSTTKFIDGHSLALGGALVSRDAKLLERIRFIRKCTGAIQSPFNAWATINGLKTLPLRLARQSETALTIARWLHDHHAVDVVNYAGLATGATRELAESQHLPALGGRTPCHGAVLSFEVRGGVEAARLVAETLQLCTLVEHVGSVETLVTHPATMTHADVPAGHRRSCGIADGLLRLSVGLEPSEAIIADLERAISIATNKAGSAQGVAECARV
ncbi:MAG: aminotransferase class I/II-fold pyridoxal phosphate-dependent enzyme [Phycisphaera sp.]|nr:MAG: aminotransferase class I/II-fold pyridoxal phosphate-dependent enzyme [Phycisphaera sp.]